MARKPRPAPTAARGKIIGQRYDEERGWVYDIAVELPGDEEPSPREFTLKQQMILAIVRRDYRGRALPDIATIHRHVAKAEVWEAECARQKPPVKLAKPGRDTVARTLRAASLIE
jgi:hypothetical protein